MARTEAEKHVGATVDASDPDDAPAPSQGPAAPGSVIAGRYRIERLIGEGGMGAVYAARHVAIGRPVAVKFLHGIRRADAKLIERFMQEARTAGEIRHRNIVEVIDFGAEAGDAYLVMELLRGESFQALLDREGTLPPARAVAVLDPIVGALAFIHQRGIVHRDVKPDNVFLAEEEGASEAVPKLLDFGIARRLTPDDARLTASGALLGTPAYMAPEQAAGMREVTAAADQYALGVMLYEALSGKGPHEGEHLIALLHARATTDPTPLDRVRPDLPPALVAVVMRAIARLPGDRFDSLDALRAALAPFASTAPAASAPPLVARPVAEPAPAPSTPAPSAPSPAPAERARERRAAWPLVAAVAALVAVAATAMALHARSPSPALASSPVATPRPAPPPEPSAITPPVEAPLAPDAAPLVAAAPDAAVEAPARVEARAERSTHPRHTSHATTTNGPATATNGRMRMNIFRDLPAERHH